MCEDFSSGLGDHVPYHTGGAVMTLYDLALSKRINNNPAVVIQAVIPLLGRGRQENKEFKDSLEYKASWRRPT